MKCPKPVTIQFFADRRSVCITCVVSASTQYFRNNFDTFYVVIYHVNHDIMNTTVTEKCKVRKVL